MSLLSDFFGGKKKVNVTPDIVPKMPSQINPQAYGNLSTIADNYINNRGTGYGDDYVNKNTNPVADAARRNFRQVTAPTTSSAYSSRGLGRSSLAANELGRQEGDVESGINQTMAQFYNLNEIAKKNDVNTGINTSSNLLTGDVNQQNKQAASSADIAKNTANQENMVNDANNAKTGQFIQAGAQLVAPIVSNFAPSIGNAISGASGARTAQPTGATTDILGKSGLTAADLQRLKQLLSGGQ